MNATTRGQSPSGANLTDNPFPQEDTPARPRPTGAPEAISNRTGQPAGHAARTAAEAGRTEAINSDPNKIAWIIGGVVVVALIAWLAF